VNKRFITLVGVASVAALTLTGCVDRGAGVDGGGAAGDGDSFTITIGHSVAATAPVNLGALRFKELVEESSDGRITVEVFPAEQIGSEPELMEGLSLGNVQIALVSTAVAADVCPEMGIYALPYILEGETDRDQYESLRKLTGSDWNQETIAACADATGNLVVDNSWWYGNRNLTSNVAINAPADLQGLIIRTPPADLHTLAIRAFGAEPLPMAFSEVYSALDTGVIDGQENPISTIYQNAFFEVQDYISLTKHMTQNQALVMNAEYFEAMSAEDQELVRSAIDEAGQYQSDLQLTTNEEELEKLRDEGMNVVEPDLAPFRAAVVDAVADFLAGLNIEASTIKDLQK